MLAVQKLLESPSQWKYTGRATTDLPKARLVRSARQIGRRASGLPSYGHLQAPAESRGSRRLSHHLHTPPEGSIQHRASISRVSARKQRSKARMACLTFGGRESGAIEVRRSCRDRTGWGIASLPRSRWGHSCSSAGRNGAALDRRPWRDRSVHPPSCSTRTLAADSLSA